MADGGVGGSRAPKRRAWLTRNNRLPWTPEDVATLVREWGELSPRTLREKLGRTAGAIARKAWDLRLPDHAAAEGCVTAHVACRRLGIHHPTLRALLRECGIDEGRAAPLRLAPARYRHRSIDAVAAGDLLAVRDARTITLGAWCSREARCCQHVRRRAVRFGVLQRAAVARGPLLRYPVAMLESVIAATPPYAPPGGPWLDLWRAVLALPSLSCAPWVVALAAWDLGHERAPAWVEHLPTSVVALARSLAHLPDATTPTERNPRA